MDLKGKKAIIIGVMSDQTENKSIINEEIKKKLDALFPPLWEALAYMDSEEFRNEKEKCDEIFNQMANGEIEWDEGVEEYCQLFNLEDLRERVRDVCTVSRDDEDDEVDNDK